MLSSAQDPTSTCVPIMFLRLLCMLIVFEAETNAGGFPGWVTIGYGPLRNDDPRYTAAWTPYMTAIGNIVSKHTITRGGNVILYQIENGEYPCLVFSFAI